MSDTENNKNNEKIENTNVEMLEDLKKKKKQKITNPELLEKRRANMKKAQQAKLDKK